MIQIYWIGAKSLRGTASSVGQNRDVILSQPGDCCFFIGFERNENRIYAQPPSLINGSASFRTNLECI